MSSYRCLPLLLALSVVGLVHCAAEAEPAPEPATGDDQELQENADGTPLNFFQLTTAGELSGQKGEIDAPKLADGATLEKVYRGGLPRAKQFEYLRAHGFKTIISLVDGAFIDKEYEKVLGPKPWVPEYDNAVKFGFLKPAGYMKEGFGAFNVFADVADHMDRSLAAMADPARQPVYVHCSLGVDRTGLLIGLHRIMHDGWTPKRAYTEMKSHGYKNHLFPKMNDAFNKAVDKLKAKCAPDNAECKSTYDFDIKQF